MSGEEILTRAILALAIAGGGLLLYWAINRIQVQRINQARPDLPRTRPGVPAILYFTTPECAPCKTIQRPALRRLQERLGDRLEVIEIDAHQHPDLAGKWGVMSVPTTFILDSRDTLHHVNHGVTPAEKLLSQLEELVKSI
jgi:thiol-disulfide isomerase/thioredoxin